MNTLELLRGTPLEKAFATEVLLEHDQMKVRRIELAAGARIPPCQMQEDVVFVVLTGRVTFHADGLRAFGANAKLGATVPVSWKPRLGVQYTWGSGDSNPTDGVHETFDGVYGGRDIFFYGYLNLFFWANLRDAELDFSAKPWRGVTLNVEYHHFNLDQANDAWYTTGLKVARRDISGASGTTLGDEFDARVALSLWNHLELMAGYGRFFPGEFVRTTGASAPANWYFAQAAYSW